MDPLFYAWQHDLDGLQLSTRRGLRPFGPHRVDKGKPAQLDTKRIELSEFSRIAAATLPKNSVSPAGRPTPITIKLYCPTRACRRIASSGETSRRSAVRIDRPSRSASSTIS